MNRISKFNLGSVTVRVSRLEILYLLPRSHKSTDGGIYEKAWIFFSVSHTGKACNRRGYVRTCVRFTSASVAFGSDPEEGTERGRERTVCGKGGKKLLLALSHWSLTQTWVLSSVGRLRVFNRKQRATGTSELALGYAHSDSRFSSYGRYFLFIGVAFLPSTIFLADRKAPSWSRTWPAGVENVFCMARPILESLSIYNVHVDVLGDQGVTFYNNEQSSSIPLII